MTAHLSVLRAPPVTEDHLFPNLPDLDPRMVRLPQAQLLARWRKTADAQLETALSDFDKVLLDGGDVPGAARDAIDVVVHWARDSTRSLSTPEGTEIVRGLVRQQAVAAWHARSEEVVERAGHDPDAVDRHLRLFVGMSYEAAARGYAAIVARAV
ncbi:MAG: hypothetical protein GY913_08965 [Proteobacteria bacterium]|nr:hypothetical protein [Pseudomonadota bacterium]MCP4917041.1 hypothetical protein [Pseudomonadota bacterium]